MKQLAFIFILLFGGHKSICQNPIGKAEIILLDSVVKTPFGLSRYNVNLKNLTDSSFIYTDLRRSIFEIRFGTGPWKQLEHLESFITDDRPYEAGYIKIDSIFTDHGFINLFQYYLDNPIDTVSFGSQQIAIRGRYILLDSLYNKQWITTPELSIQVPSANSDDKLAYQYILDHGDSLKYYFDGIFTDPFGTYIRSNNRLLYFAQNFPNSVISSICYIQLAKNICINFIKNEIFQPEDKSTMTYYLSRIHDKNIPQLDDLVSEFVSCIDKL